MSLMATSSSVVEKRTHLGFLCFLMLTLCLGVATSSYGLDLAAGVAFPRGSYENALGVQTEYVMRISALPTYLTSSARVSGYLASRDKITLAVGSGSLLIKAMAPQSISNPLGFSPYIAVGPSVNYLYSSADLEDFGTVSDSRSSVTLSAFVGVEFFPAARVSIFGEARETVPSTFTFDYVMVGLKYHGARRPSIE